MSVKQRISGLDRAIQCAASALDKKAYNVRILEIERLSSIADFLVIASGKSDKQVQAIAESIRSELKQYGKALDIEGMTEGKWVVIDYGDVLVHVFNEDMRRYYDLDELWSAAPLIPVPAEYLWEEKELR